MHGNCMFSFSWLPEPMDPLRCSRTRLRPCMGRATQKHLRVNPGMSACDQGGRLVGQANAHVAHVVNTQDYFISSSIFSCFSIVWSRGAVVSAHVQTFLFNKDSLQFHQWNPKADPETQSPQHVLGLSQGLLS